MVMSRLASNGQPPPPTERSGGGGPGSPKPEPEPSLLGMLMILLVIGAVHLWLYFDTGLTSTAHSVCC
jgi:hypothetical protein